MQLSNPKYRSVWTHPEITQCLLIMILRFVAGRAVMFDHNYARGEDVCTESRQCTDSGCLQKAWRKKWPIYALVFFAFLHCLSSKHRAVLTVKQLGSQIPLFVPSLIYMHKSTEISRASCDVGLIVMPACDPLLIFRKCFSFTSSSSCWNNGLCC